jgi:O-antigen ligase
LVALGIFALIVLAGPLLFGAVDRLPQIGLLVLLGIGIVLQPPAIMPLSRWGNRLALAFVALLLFKEFAPANWFGDTFWRTTLTRQYLLQLPFTHHPEPVRALDALLAGAVGVVWFLWVRRLASDRQHRAFLAWVLVGAAAVVAVVSFGTRHPGSDAIFGVRYTPGWSGFGPFPNRNHSADYFAMAAVLGCGCVAWAAARKKWLIFCGGILLVGTIVIALLTTESRGGLIACGAGLGIYLLLCLAKIRTGKAVGAALGAAMFFAVIALTFGGGVFARFQAHGTAEVSNQTRISVWHDAIGMWKDAPLLGHGLDSFASVFPLYQKIQLENQVVIHPESSWLQWLTELGLIPVLLAVAAVVLFLGRHLRAIFDRHRSFFLHAGGFAAFAVLLVHALFDVPAHRWGTAGFALAALAIACPMRLGGRQAREPRQAALVPLLVAAFWWLPLQFDVPAWSPLQLVRLVEQDAHMPGMVPLAELETELHYFPLNADLHQSVGVRELRLYGRQNPTDWQRHFAIASRLEPGVWEVAQSQARACERVSPLLALGYWQEAVQRGGIHRDEILRTAVQETMRFPAAQAAWGRYVEAHPELLLAYAQGLPETMGRYYFGRWWKLRSSSADLTPSELRDFYKLAARWGNREDFEEWAHSHSALGVRDYRQWAALLHAWGEDDRAWQLLSIKLAEPSFPNVTLTTPRDRMERTWVKLPENVLNAQQLALARLRDGEMDESNEIVITVAQGKNAPQWFVEKAAWILARANRTKEAVELLLRVP